MLGVVAQAPRSAQETLASLQQRELVSKVRRLASALGTVTPGRESDEAPTPLLEPFPISALEAPSAVQAHRTAASILPVPGLQPCDGIMLIQVANFVASFSSSSSFFRRH